MADDSQSDQTPEWQCVTEALAASKRAYLDADNVYDSVGRKVATAVGEQLAPYYDPAQRRAKIIQEFAQRLSEEIIRFDATRTTLAWTLAPLLMRFDGVSIAISQAMLTGSAPKQNVGA